LCGFCKCSHIVRYAALSKTPHALADGLMLVFQHPGTLNSFLYDFRDVLDDDVIGNTDG
jgi:hypothetical protein